MLEEEKEAGREGTEEDRWERSGGGERWMGVEKGTRQWRIKALVALRQISRFLKYGLN